MLTITDPKLRQPTLEEQTIQGMLKEILAGIENEEKAVKAQQAKDNEDNEGQELKDFRSAPRPQFHALAKDPETALATLYAHLTDKDPTKEYVAGHPLIHVAIEYQRNDFLTILVPKNAGEAYINKLEACRDYNKDNPLHCAARNANAAAVTILLKEGFNVNATRGNRELTALTLAVDQDKEQIETVEALLDSLQINVEQKIALAIRSPENAWGMAAKRGHEKIMGKLLSHINDITSISVRNESVQSWAVNEHKYEIITTLVKNKQLNFDEHDGISETSIMHVIAKYGLVDAYHAMSKADKKKHINILDKTLRTPITYALDYNRKAMANLLIDDGADLTTVDSKGRTIWHFIAESAHVDLAEKIAQKHPVVLRNINEMDADGYPPLHAAVHGVVILISHRSESPQSKMVQFFLRYANQSTIDYISPEGTLIQLAIDKIYPEAVLAVLAADERVEVNCTVNAIRGKTADKYLGKFLMTNAKENGWAYVKKALDKRKDLLVDAAYSSIPTKLILSKAERAYVLFMLNSIDIKEKSAIFRGALDYLKKLIQQEGRNLRKKLQYFYALASAVGVDIKYPQVEMQTLDREGETIAAMLKEIYAQTDNKNEPHIDYFALTEDPSKALANLYEHMPKKDPTKEYISGFPLIHVAIFYERNDFLKTLVPENTDEKKIAHLENCRDANRDNPLHTAARLGRPCTIPILLAGGFNVNALRGNRKLTPLILAIDAQNNTAETVAALLASTKIDTEHKISWAFGRPDNAWDIVMESSKNNSKPLALLALLLIRKEKFWLLKIGERSVQEWAQRYSVSVVITALAVNKQLDLSARYDGNETIMFTIARLGLVDAYDAIDDRIKYLNHSDDDGWTPLYAAVQAGHTELAIGMINDGATISMRASLWHLIASRAYSDLAETVYTKNKDIDAPNTDGYPPLHWAIRSVIPVPEYKKELPERMAIIKFFLKYSSDITVKSSFGKGSAAHGTVLDLAIQANAPKIIAVLLEDARVSLSPAQSVSLSLMAIENDWVGVTEALRVRAQAATSSATASTFLNLYSGGTGEPPTSQPSKAVENRLH